MDLAHSEALVGQVEESPERVPLYYGDLETMIATVMENIHQLSLTGDWLIDANKISPLTR